MRDILSFFLNLNTIIDSKRIETPIIGILEAIQRILNLLLSVILTQVTYLECFVARHYVGGAVLKFIEIDFPVAVHREDMTRAPW